MATAHAVLEIPEEAVRRWHELAERRDVRRRIPCNCGCRCATSRSVKQAATAAPRADRSPLPVGAA